MPTFASFATLQAFRAQLQEALTAQHPGTVILDGNEIPCAIAPRTMGMIVEDGRTRQIRTLVFLVKKDDLSLELLREVSRPSQPLRKGVKFTHKETGLKYLLTNEWSEPNSTHRRLECEESEK